MTAKRGTKTTKRLLSIGEAAKFLGVSIDTLRNWEEKGKVKPVRQEGGIRRYRASQLKKLQTTIPYLANKLPQAETTVKPQPQEENLIPAETKEDNWEKVNRIITVQQSQPQPQPAIIEETEISDLPLARTHHIKLIQISTFTMAGTLSLAVIAIGLIVLSYFLKPHQTQEFFKGGQVLAASTQANSSPFDSLVSTILSSLNNGAQKAVTVFSPQLAQDMGIIPPPQEASASSITQMTAGSSSSEQFLEINANAVINGTINGFKLTSNPDGFSVSAGTTPRTLTVNGTDITINQSLATTATPTFSTLNLSATKNQITFGSGGILTWTPTSSSKTLTLPDATTTLMGSDTTDTLKNKTIKSSDSNTISGSFPDITGITSLGTISTGTWNGTTIATGYGGTGLTSYTKGDIMYASDTNVLKNLTLGTSGQVLTASSSGTPYWSAASGGVSSVNSLSGTLTIAGAGINSVTASNNTITINGTEADTLATVTGRGATTNTAVTFSSTINSNTFTSTALTFAGTSPAISASTPGTNINLDAGTTGKVIIAGTSTGDVDIAGGSTNTGCTINNSTGDLTCSGNISGSSTGTAGYWTRAGTSLSPATGGDSITTSGNISTSGTGTLSIGGAATFNSTINSNTFTSTALTFAGTTPVISASTATTDISLNPGVGGHVLLAGGSGSTGCTVDDTTGNLTCSGSISSTGSSDVGFWSRNSGTSTLSPVTSGDNVSTTGNISTTGTGTVTSGGLLTGQTGLTITGGAVSLNISSNYNTNINTGTSSGAISIGNSAAGAITLQSGAASTFHAPANTATAFRLTDGTNAYQTLDTRNTLSGVSAFTFTAGTAPTIASAANAEYTTATFTPPTIALTGTTQVTSQMDSHIFNAPIITDSSAVTVDKAATLTIAGAPVSGAAGSVTLTNSYALKINSASVDSGTGTVTNAYGLYVDAPTGAATNNYMAYFNSANTSGTDFQINNTGVMTGTVFGLTADSLTTGKGLDISLDGLSSGIGLNLTSTSASLTSGSLATFDWSPTGTTNIYATGDLVSIGTGNSYAHVGNLLNVKSQGSSVFSISDTTITNALPTSFTAPGDVAVAYDLNFTNPTASYIKSNAPLYITAGKNFNSSDLVLTTYNQGSVIFNKDFAGSAVTNYASQITGSDTTANANTDYGLYSNLALTGNAAKTGVGLYSTLSTSSTTADTLIAADLATSTTGVITSGTRNVYGLRSQPNSTAASTGGTTNVYGGYFKADGTVGAGGTINSYGLYVANGTMNTTGTSTNIGLYIESPTGADTNYAAIFAGGNVGIGTTAPSAKLEVDGNLRFTDPGITGQRDINLENNNGGIRIYASDTLAASPTGAAIQFFGNNQTTYGGQAYIDSGALDTAALIFRTAGTGGNVAERMRITSGGRIGIGTGGNNPNGSVENAYAGAASVPAELLSGTWYTGGTSTTTKPQLLVEPASTTSTGWSTAGTGLGINAAQTFAGNLLDLQQAGNSIFKVAGASSAVNGFTFTTTATGTAPTFAATGSDANIGLNINSKGTGAITLTSANATGTTTSSGFAFTDNSLTTGTGSYFSSSSLTTGKLVDINTGSGNTSQTTGTLLNLTSTSTSLTTGGLLAMDWTPGSATTATGDLFSINVGANGTVGNLFNLKNNGSSIFSVSQTQITNALPTSFTAPGDVAVAYDLNFTNPTASYIKSSAPLYIQSGEVFNSSDLTLKTYNQGSIVLDSSVTTGTGVNFNNSTLTTGTGVNIASTTLTSGTLLNVAPTFAGSAVTGYGLYINGADSTANSNTDYNQYNVLALTGNAAKTGYGLYSTVTSTSTTADTTYGGYFNTAVSGAVASGTQNTYGIYGRANSTSLAGGTSNVYGGYFKADGTVASGTINSYGLYVANGTMNTTGTSTNVGLYVESPTGADNNYAAIFAGGHVGIGDTSPSEAPVTVRASAGPGYFFTDGTVSLQTWTGSDAGYNYAEFGTISNNPLGFFTNNSSPSVTITTAGYLGIGTGAPGGLLDVTKTLSGTPSTTGKYLSISASTFTDNATAATSSATAMVFNSIAKPTLAASNLSVTTTNAATLYIAGAPTAGTNQTITNAYALWSVGNVRIGAGSLCVNSTDAACSGSVAGTIYASNTTVQAADLAENYISSQKLEPGDLVIPASDGNNKAIIPSTGSPYQREILGAISTNPGVTLNSDAKTDSAHPYLYPIALSGRVPVKVSIESGNIKAGDYLTSSSTPGVAMKATHAGQMIGKALEEFKCPEPVEGLQTVDKQCTGKIMVFINPSYADPNDLLANLTLDQNGNLVSNTSAANATNQAVTQPVASSSASLNTDLTQALTPINTDIESLKAQVASLSARLDILTSSTYMATTSAQIATGSAKLAYGDVLGLSSVMESTPSANLYSSPITSNQSLITALDATISGSLKSLGNTYLGNTTIAGDFSIDGTMSINGNSLSSIGTLFIQNGPLTNLVDFFNGKVTIDKAGNVTMNKLTISSTNSINNPTDPTIGSAKISAWQTSITIYNNQVTGNSKIFITPRSSTSGQTPYIKEVVPGVSFTVSLDHGLSYDLPFDWWIVDTK